MRIGDREEFIAGGIFVACGIWFLLGSLSLEAGSISVPGPGWLPRVIAGALAVIGLVIMLRSFAMPSRKIGPFGAYPLFILLLSMAVFALAIDRFGMLLTSAASVLLVTLALPSMPLWQRLILVAGCSVFTTLVFSLLIGIPVPVLPQ